MHFRIKRLLKIVTQTILYDVLKNCQGIFFVVVVSLKNIINSICYNNANHLVQNYRIWKLIVHS